MSAINAALRATLKRALRCRTYADDRVFDSEITPLEELVESGTKPLIIVTTDDDESTFARFDMQAEPRALDIVVEMTLASAITVEAGAVSIEIPQTDASMEFVLDLMQVQVQQAIKHPACPWADLFRTFACTPTKLLKRRGASTEKGVRFAARQLILTCNPLFEPESGASLDPDGPWGQLVALMAADPDLDDHATLLKAQIEGTPLPSWQRVQAALGLTQAGIFAMGLAPFPGGADPQTGEPPVQTEATLDDEQTGPLGPIRVGSRETYEIPAEDA